MKLLALCLIAMILPSCVIRTTYGSFKPTLINGQGDKSPVTTAR